MNEQSASQSAASHPEGLPQADGWPVHPAMVSSTQEIPGFRVLKNFGIVQGLVVRSPGVSGGFTAALQSFSGGNVRVLQELCEQARRDAFLLMMQDAVRYGANAIIGFRYDTTEISQGLSEVLAYGTAVWAERST
jgi:uncharacterized protein YbjQ (UPF0145 family)